MTTSLPMSLNIPPALDGPRIRLRNVRRREPSASLKEQTKVAMPIIDDSTLRYRGTPANAICSCPKSGQCGPGGFTPSLMRGEGT